MPNTAAMVLLLLLPILPVCRLFLIRGFRRRLSLFPARLLILSAAVLGYIAAAVILAVLWPEMVPAALLVVLAITVYLYAWRARPNYGRRRRLPPGSLRLAPSSPWREEHWSRQQFRRYGPVFKTSHLLQPMVCINSIELAKRLLLEHKTSLATPPMPFNAQIPSGFMRYLPPRTYAAYRAGFGAAFSSAQVPARHVEAVRDIFRRHLLSASAAGAVADPALRLQRSLNDIVLLLFLGLGTENERHAECAELLSRLDYRRALFTGKRKTRRCLIAFERLIAELPLTPVSYVSELRAQPSLAAALREADPSLWRNFIYIMITAGIDVADLLLWLWHDLAENPRWGERVSRCEPSAASSHRRELSLPVRIVMESLRLHQSEYLMRRTLGEIDLGDYTIPRHWLVRVSVADAHRDPVSFDRPDQFDPDRFLSAQPSGDRYAPFGLAPRPCLGRQLTLWTGEQLLLAVFGHCHTRTLADGPAELGVFHWRPSERWRPELLYRR